VRFKKVFVSLFLLLLTASFVYSQEKTTGSIKGKVKVEVGSPSGVKVAIRQGEREVSSVTTDKGGDFTANRLPPGIYGLTFRKPGLSIGTMENIEVKAGKSRSVGDGIFLSIDEGSIAFVRGSVFNAADRSVQNAKVELLKVGSDGSTKKIDSRLTTETGSFAFRLSPDVAKYRVTVKVDGTEVSKDVEIDGAAVYRVALSLVPPAKP
jgi:hypothetical protein